MKIVHIITGLGDGGAEHTLFKICKYDIKNEHIVISLRTGGKYYPILKKLGIKVYCFNFSFFSIFKFFFLIKLLRFLNPDIVQTWLVHADFLGGIASRIAGIKTIIWNVRYSNIEVNRAKLITNLILKLLKILSYFIPKIIIINSKMAKKHYEIKGYSKEKLKYIPNGYDLLKFKINKRQKNIFQKKLNTKKRSFNIGYVARFDPIKDHLNLIKALLLIRPKNINFICILIGTNINKNNILFNMIKKNNLKDKVKLLGPTKNISNVMNWLDIHIQSSRSEGFPNVVAEAMAHGTPCVVTNVGDSAHIIGKTGWVVPPENTIKLAKGIEKALKEIGAKNWNKRCNKARARIKDKFSLSKMIENYNKVWTEVYKNYVLSNNKKF